MQRVIDFTAICCAGLLCLASPAMAEVRIKDITELEGARSNQLVGFGLVVGLDNTGGKGPFTQQTAVDMLSRFNVNIKITSDIKGDVAFKSGNISAVMITAELGPFSRRGSRLDVTVSALDDASSLRGGTLIMTPLRGADSCDYAVAQGPILVGGFSFSAGAARSGSASVQKNHPTVGRIVGGATVEREARGEILCNGQIRLLLSDPDFQTSRAITKAINDRFANSAITLDAGTVQVFVPKGQCSNLVSFVSDLGALEVKPDVAARVVLNERTGTIVAGDQVKIDGVALAHGNLSIVTSDESVVSQPLPFSRGKSVLAPRPQVGVSEQPGAVQVLSRSVTVAELARALNALGATPSDLITIFQMLKQAGALHAELIIM